VSKGLPSEQQLQLLPPSLQQQLQQLLEELLQYCLR